MVGTLCRLFWSWLRVCLALSSAGVLGGGGGVSVRVFVLIPLPPLMRVWGGLCSCCRFLVVAGRSQAMSALLFIRLSMSGVMSVSWGATVSMCGAIPVCGVGVVGMCRRVSYSSRTVPL